MNLFTYVANNKIMKTALLLFHDPSQLSIIYFLRDNMMYLYYPVYTTMAGLMSRMITLICMCRMVEVIKLNY